MSEQILNQILDVLKEIKASQYEIKTDIKEMKHKQKLLSCDVDFIMSTLNKPTTKPYEHYENSMYKERDKKIEALNQRVLIIEKKLQIKS